MDEEKEARESAAGDRSNLSLRGRALKLVEGVAERTGIPKTRILALGAMALERELGDEEMFVQLPELAAILGSLDAKIGDILLESDYARKLVVQALSVEVDLPIQVLGPEAISGESNEG